jgi:alpha-amylase
LRDRLKNLCDTYGYSLENLAEPGTILTDRPSDAVTFVGNHDISRSNDIINDKMLAYAFILSHEGYPCVFWQDYYNLELAKVDSNNGIAALVRIHEENAGGTTSVLYVDDNLYVMQRNGFEDQSGLIFALNNQGNTWQGYRVQTNWKNTKFVPVAWYSHSDLQSPLEKWTDDDGWGEFWAPPRGYAVYLPTQG